MAWEIFQVTYELHSPLHIGYHKVGNVQHTRYYLPARNLWGAVTERLTCSGFKTARVPQSDYRRIGEWVKIHCRFGYFFISEGNELLAPQYQDSRLYYGYLPQTEFERRYLDSHVSTALDATTTSAEDGSLHEVEFIAPYPRQEDPFPERTRLRGWIFLEEEAADVLGEEEKWRSWLGDLRVGGERRYGFGRLRLLSLRADSAMNDFSVELDLPSPRVHLQAGNTLPAHVLAQGVPARGAIEPLVGRETQQSHAFGVFLTRGQVCWAPGSVLTEKAIFQFEPEGYWTFISKG